MDVILAEVTKGIGARGMAPASHVRVKSTTSRMAQ